jgi:imidazolonepropionase-like amidohydrolase
VGRAPWEKLLAAGICTCLGTDSLASNQDLNLWHELAFFIQGLDYPLSLAEAVAMITWHPARALFLDHCIGTLETGKVPAWTIVPETVLTLF